MGSPAALFLSKRTLLWLTVTLAASLLLLWTLNSKPAFAQDTSGPSAFCHVTNGDFNDCDDDGDNLGPADEWADIIPGTFDGGGVVYADQADLVQNALVPTTRPAMYPTRTSSYRTVSWTT